MEKKQVEALKDLIDNNVDDYENKLLIWKEGEIFNNIYNKMLDKIEELDKKN